MKGGALEVGKASTVSFVWTSVSIILIQLYSNPIIFERMIEVKNIEKSFGETKILKGISTVFETGKTNLIIGQSGSGKTVLLKSFIGNSYS